MSRYQPEVMTIIYYMEQNKYFLFKTKKNKYPTFWFDLFPLFAVNFCFDIYVALVALQIPQMLCTFPPNFIFVEGSKQTNK